MSVSKRLLVRERRLINMRKGLERESAKALDLAMERAWIEELAENQIFVVEAEEEKER